MITARVDLQTRGSGIVLITGAHGFLESPQALLGRQDGKWYAEDDNADGDTWRDGVTVRPSFFELAKERDAVVRKWLRHLEIDPADVEIVTEREY